jgi:hypothetical protein
VAASRGLAVLEVLKEEMENAGIKGVARDAELCSQAFRFAGRPNQELLPQSPLRKDTKVPLSPLVSLADGGSMT